MHDKFNSQIEKLLSEEDCDESSLQSLDLNKSHRNSEDIISDVLDMQQNPMKSLGSKQSKGIRRLQIFETITDLDEHLEYKENM